MTDEFDFKDEKAKKSFRFGSALWNIASLLILLAALCVGAFFVLIFLNPQSGLNPLPPGATAVVQAPTATLQATAASEELATATGEPATATAEVAGGSFAIQEGSPTALDSSVFHPELACNFLGIAGQVFGLDGLPISDMRVQVTGTLGGEPVSKLGLTGAATSYGDGAYYEIQLADAPVVSEGTLQIVLFDATDQPISDPVTFSTTDSCQQNLILINFNEQP
ncbi:MAG: hypothetical protein WEC37_05015 [Anaerolineales bacterium]